MFSASERWKRIGSWGTTEIARLSGSVMEAAQALSLAGAGLLTGAAMTISTPDVAAVAAAAPATTTEF